MTMYRLSWEMVKLNELWRFSNADPRMYKNTTQTVPNSEIPDEYWGNISKETDNPWQQFNALKQWADEDREFVSRPRKVCWTCGQWARGSGSGTRCGTRWTG